MVGNEAPVMGGLLVSEVEVLHTGVGFIYLFKLA